MRAEPHAKNKTSFFNISKLFGTYLNKLIFLEYYYYLRVNENLRLTHFLCVLVYRHRIWKGKMCRIPILRLKCFAEPQQIAGTKIEIQYFHYY